MERVNLAGAAHLMLQEGVLHFDQPRAVFEKMAEGWARQQKSRMLTDGTIAGRLTVLNSFRNFTDSYPWNWTPSDVEDWTSSLLSRTSPLAHSTIRGYQNNLRLFMEYITDPRYAWAGECERRFGEHPVQICPEWNTIEHLSEFEGRPGVRPLTYDELQAFFDRCDQRVSEIRDRGRKGSLAALRDAQLFKTIYAWGLRRREATGLDLADLHSNPHAKHWGKYAALHVRYGKGVKGSPPRRRTVLAVPEMDWAIEGLRHYVEEIRPAFDPDRHPALWVTERRARLSPRDVDRRFAEIRDEAGLSSEHHPHSLRHSYVTHLIEFGYDERFVQEQVGHSYASTTAIYAGVSGDYKNRVLARAMDRIYGKDKGS